MLSFAVSPGTGWILTKGAFVAGTQNVNVGSKFMGCCAPKIVGESAWMVKVTCDEPMGMFWAGSFGEIQRHEIPPGKTLLVDNALFFGAHERTRMRIVVIGGVKTCCCGGEGIAMAFDGPAIVYTQSRDPEVWSALNQPPNSADQNGAMAGANHPDGAHGGGNA